MAEKDINLEYLLSTLKTILEEVEKLGTRYDINDPKVQGTITAIISAMRVLRVYSAYYYNKYVKDYENQ
jgi:hypothetical protein